MGTGRANTRRAGALLLAALLIVGCDAAAGSDAGSSEDAGSGRRDGGSTLDGGARVDAASPLDAGPGPSERCPAGSGSLVLDLSGVSLAAVPGVPIADGALTGFSILEGPVWAGGALLLSHFQDGAGRIYRVTEAGAASVARADTESNGLALGPDGRLYAGVHGDGSVSSFDLDDLGAAPTVVAGQFGGTRFNSPNDLVVRSDGNLYFTDPTWQAPTPAPQGEPSAYRVDPSGAVTRLSDLPAMPNGIALTLDERTLFIGGTDGLRSYTLGADGAVTSGATEVASIDHGTDGLGIDCAGNLYVTGDDRVTVLSPTLAVLGTLDAPSATNVAFGGADGATLYVTTLGSSPQLLSAHLNVPGLPY